MVVMPAKAQHPQACPVIGRTGLPMDLGALPATRPPRVRDCPAADPATPAQSHLPAGCRCPVDATTTHQFIRALAVIGWSLKAQGRLLGSVDGSKFRRILAQACVERATAMRVAHLYARLWDVPGPDQHTIAWAARQGWQAADPVVVARLVTGKPCPHTRLDRDQAIRVLAAQGRSATTIATRLRISGSTVCAITRTANGVAA